MSFLKKRFSIRSQVNPSKLHRYLWFPIFCNKNWIKIVFATAIMQFSLFSRKKSHLTFESKPAIIPCHFFLTLFDLNCSYGWINTYFFNCVESIKVKTAIFNSIQTNQVFWDFFTKYAIAEELFQKT